MADVSIVRCEKYDMEAAEAALLQVLEPLGGLDWVKSGMRVAIKANLVSSLKPEAAATTHPVLLCALTKLLVQRGAQVVVGDSPGGLYTPAYVNRVYAASGSSVCRSRPHAIAFTSVGTRCGSSPMTRAHTRSNLPGSVPARIAPSGRGFPAVGPLPSMATTASTMHSFGLK